MPTPVGKKVISVYVDEDLREDITKLAKLKNQSVNGFIVTLIQTAQKAAKKQGDI